MDIHAERTVFFVNVPKASRESACKHLERVLKDTHVMVMACRIHSRDNGAGKAILMVEALTVDAAGAEKARAAIRGA